MFEELKEILQAATAPMVLISGTGIFLLTLNARFINAVGRLWEIDREIKASPGDEVLKMVMEKLITRCRLLRWSLGFLVMSIISSGMLMILTLTAVLMGYQLKVPGVILLTSSCLFILLSMIILFVDVLHSFKATMLKIGR